MINVQRTPSIVKTCEIQCLLMKSFSLVAEYKVALSFHLGSSHLLCEGMYSRECYVQFQVWVILHLSSICGWIGLV